MWLAPDVSRQLICVIFKGRVSDKGRPWQLTPPRCLATSGANYPVTGRHISEEWTRYLNHCESVKCLQHYYFHRYKKFASCIWIRAPVVACLSVILTFWGRTVDKIYCQHKNVCFWFIVSVYRWYALKNTSIRPRTVVRIGAKYLNPTRHVGERT